MADSAAARTAMDALIAENWSNQCVDTLFNAMPLMGIFFGRNGMKKGHIGIGVPDAGYLTTGSKQASVRRKEILSSRIYQPLIKHLLPAEGDGKVLSTADNLPTRTGWESNSPAKRFKRPAVKWCELSDPCEVPNEDIRNTTRTAQGERNGWEAIGSLLRVERDDVLGIHMRRWNELLMGTYTGTVASTTGAPTDENDEKWDAPHSIFAALASTGMYCDVDRDAAGNSYWKGNTISTATAPVLRDMIRYANYTMELPDGTKGLRAKGYGIDVIACGFDLYPTFLAEAEARGGQVVLSGTPIQAFGQFGFQNDIVRVDNTWVIPIPDWPTGKVVGLNPKTWTVAIHPDANYKQTKPVDNSEVKGGDDSTSWVIRSKKLVVCEAPSLNVAWTSVG